MKTVARKRNGWRLVPVLGIVALLAVLVFGLATSAAFAQDGDADDAETVFPPTVVTTTTTANVNLRVGPGLNFDIIETVPRGTVVGFTGFTDITGNWVQVDPAGDAPVGWMHVSLLGNVPDDLQIRPADLPEEDDAAADEDAAPADEDAAFPADVATAQTTVNLNLRDAPTLEANVVDVIPRGTAVGFTGFMDVTGNWVQVDPAGDLPVGWVWAPLLTDTPDQLQIRPAAGVTPSVTVMNQALGTDSAVTVPQVTATQAGWLVIHANDNGAPGAVIGQAAVPAGVTENVTVNIDQSAATETLFAMLHVDAGTAGVYEFPGADVPVSVNGNVVVDPFTVTDLVAEEDVADEDAAFPAGVVTTTTTANVNLRMGPGTNFNIIQTVPRGTVVGFTGFTDVTGNWVQVDPAGDAPVGWMHVSLLNTVPDDLTVTELEQ